MNSLCRKASLWLGVLPAVLFGFVLFKAGVTSRSSASWTIPSANTASVTLVISEVLYDPSGAEPDGEWIEIYNAGCTSIDLAGFKVGDEVSSGGTEGMMRFPNGAVLIPGQAIVVANRATAFFTLYGFKPDYEMLESDPAVPSLESYAAWANGSVALHNEGDDVLLLDDGDSVVDGLSWGTSSHFFTPAAPDVPEGRSLERRPADVDTDVAGDWAGQPSPDPGRVALGQVSSWADCGPGTLRLHLLSATPGMAITFDPAVFPPASPATIALQSALPALTHNNMSLDASNAGVILDGGAIASAEANGIRISGAEGVTIKGLQILNFPDDGIEIVADAQDATIGGSRSIGVGPLGEGNLISGNDNDGIYVTGAKTSGNTIQGNLIGLTLDGGGALGNTDDGIHVSQKAHDNIIGGTTPDRQNVIGGNGSDGVFLTLTTTANIVLGNLIGIDASGNSPIPNGDDGIHLSMGAHHNTIGGTAPGEGNRISGNTEDGVYLTEPETLGNTISGNAIYGNGARGIGIHSGANGALSAPTLVAVTTDTVSGATVPNARVEFFSDDDDEGRIYEGFTTADGTGNFSFSKVEGFAGPNVTATSTDSGGNTSEFSQPVHLLWTLLIYLNGDNDLEALFTNTLTNTIAAGPSPRANVLVLMDGYTTTAVYSGTVLYDVTRGETTRLDVPWNVSGELNMGDGQTLVDFVVWSRVNYPARHTLLSIVDHGGGWAPSGSELYTGALARHRHWMAGNSGLSWDFTNDYDYLDSQEIRQAMATITNDGADPLDVVFYDVCLMGMVEVAYQIKEYATFFVSSQNIGWAPVGEEGGHQHRYIRTIQGLEPTASPRQLAELLVETYRDAIPSVGHPFAISAVDLTALSGVANAADNLATIISQTLTGPDQAALFHSVYSATQKIDYDSDFFVESATEGFVDLYDLAVKATQQFSDPGVVAAAQSLMTALDSAVVAEEHRSGSPWFAPERTWDLDDVHGLSIFLPLGEDLEMPILVTETAQITAGSVQTRNLRLRDMYICDQLRFVCDTAWGGLIHTYYEVTSLSVPIGKTEGPVDGLLPPDVVPPQTMITLTGVLTVGQDIEVEWVATDSQAGVEGATLWHRPPHGQWTSVASQSGSSGIFSFPVSERCEHWFAVRAMDKVGNRELLESGANTLVAHVHPCFRIYLPMVLRASTADK